MVAERCNGPQRVFRRVEGSRRGDPSFVRKGCCAGEGSKEEVLGCNSKEERLGNLGLAFFKREVFQ